MAACTVTLRTSVQGTHMATLEMSIATSGEEGDGGWRGELEFVGPITQ